MVAVNQNEFYYTTSSGAIIKTILGDKMRYFMTKETDKLIIDLVFPSENAGYAIGHESLILKYNRKNIYVYYLGMV